MLHGLRSLLFASLRLCAAPDARATGNQTLCSSAMMANLTRLGLQQGRLFLHGEFFYTDNLLKGLLQPEQIDSYS